MVKKVKDPDKKKKGEKKEEKESKPKPKIIPKREERARSLIRISGTDLDGEKKLVIGLTKIKGVNHTLGLAICRVTKIDPNKKLKDLADKEITSIEGVIKDPIGAGIPVRMVNRRRDIETGKDMHISSQDVKVSERFDIKRLIDKRSYKGVRHMLGLPVRGQRTKSSFRKGKTMGVVRRKDAKKGRT